MSGRGNRGRGSGNRGRGQGSRRGQGNRGPNRSQGNRFSFTRSNRPANSGSAAAANNGWTSVGPSRAAAPSSNRGRGRGAFRGGPSSRGAPASRGRPNRGSYYDRPMYATVEPAVNMGAAAAVNSTPSYLQGLLKSNTSTMPALNHWPTYEEMSKTSWANLMYGEVRPRNAEIPAAARAIANVPVAAVNVPSVPGANNGPAEGKRVRRNGVEYITSATASHLNTSENAGSLKEWRVIVGDQSIPERRIVYTKQGHKLFYTKRPVYSVTPEGERVVYEGIYLPYIYIDTIPYTFEQFNDMMREQEKFSREKKEIYDKQLFDRWKGATTVEEKRAVYEARESKREADAAKYGKTHTRKPFNPENAPFSDMCIQATRATKDGSEPVCYDHQYHQVIRRLFDAIDEEAYVRHTVSALEGKANRTPENDARLAGYREQLNFLTREINQLDAWESEILHKLEADEKELKECHARHPGQEDACFAEADPEVRGNISMYPNVSEFPMPSGPVYKKRKGGARKTRKGKKGSRKGRKGKKSTRRH